MWTKIVKYAGFVLIIGFCVLSIFLYQFESEIRLWPMSETRRDFLTYPSQFENRFYDFRMKLTLDENQKDDRLVLAAIDEATLKQLGRFPFSRIHWTAFMKKLKTFGAKTVAFDVIFSEPEIIPGAESPDVELSKAIADFQSIKGNRVILPYSLNSVYHHFQDENFKEIPDDMYDNLLDAKFGSEYNLEKKKISKTTYPVPELLKAKPGLAYIGAAADPDGIFRHYPLVTFSDDFYFPSYSLMAYMLYTGENPVLHVSKSGQGESYLMIKDDKKLAVNHSGESKIRWLGGSTAFPTIGIDKILNAPDDDPEMIKNLKGKLIFVGSIAFAAHDIRHTPVDAKLPGVYFHMNKTQQLLEARFFQPPQKSLMWSWGILLVGTLLMIGISLLGHAIVDAAFVTIFCGAIFFADTFLLIPKGYEITLFYSLLSVVGTYSWNTFLSFYIASKDKAFLKNAFGNYISPELIEEMYETGQPPELGGDCGIRTAYFTDIQGFSTFSEQLSATELVTLLNEYLTAMTDILLEEKGTLDKYEGDAIIAFFGAPMPLEDHAIRSCRVAVKMQKALDKLRVKWIEEGDKWPQVVKEMRMRIGINSGEIVTGNMGSASRMNYTMMGDSVNLAARLEEAAKQYGIFTQLSSFTKDMTEDKFVMRELDTVRVVGKSEPVTTYDLLGEVGDTDQNLLDLQKNFHEGLDHYKNQRWDEAIKVFMLSLENEYTRFPELHEKKTNPSLIYIERCNEFKKTPPPKDWDGVYTLTSK